MHLKTFVGTLTKRNGVSGASLKKVLKNGFIVVSGDAQSVTKVIL